MFSQELDNLILATLEDGVLQDYEKAALVKRAQTEGVDLTELEIYINSILQRRKKELEFEKMSILQERVKEKKEAFGRVCPSCGKQVSSMTLKCECGYEFTKVDANSSAQLLADKIEKISSETNLSKSQREEKIRSAIEMFPVPNTKEDMLELLSMGASNLQNKVAFFNTYTGRIILYCMACVVTAGWLLIFAITEGWFKNLDSTDGVIIEKRQKTWRLKCNQILLKGRSLRGDTDFQRQLDYYEQLIKK